MVKRGHPLDWAEGCRESETLFLGVPVRGFLEEMSPRVSDMCGPPQKVPLWPEDCPGLISVKKRKTRDGFLSRQRVGSRKTAVAGGFERSKQEPELSQTSSAAFLSVSLCLCRAWGRSLTATPLTPWEAQAPPLSSAGRGPPASIARGLWVCRSDGNLLRD